MFFVNFFGVFFTLGGEVEMFSVLVDVFFFNEEFHRFINGGLGNVQTFCDVDTVYGGLGFGKI